MSKPKTDHRRATLEEIQAGKKVGWPRAQPKTHPWKRNWFKLELQTVKHRKGKR